MTGTTPFPNASDEEIVASITMGHRPECPSNNPSQGLVDALWDQIEACWHDDPEQRPSALTMLQFLRGLIQERTQEESQEFQEPHENLGTHELLEQTDDEAWDYIQVEGTPEPRKFFFYGTHDTLD